MGFALALIDLNKSFGLAEIIRGVSLDVAAGERHAIIGPNGAGKSTLFNLISGRLAPTPPQNRTSAIDHGAADEASTSKPNRRITVPSLRANAN